MLASLVVRVSLLGGMKLDKLGGRSMDAGSISQIKGLKYKYIFDVDADY